MKYTLLFVLFLFISFKGASQNICNSCIKVKIQFEDKKISAKQNGIVLDFIIENCGTEKLKLPSPKPGFKEDDENFPNIIFSVYKIEKDNNLKIVTFPVGNVDYFSAGKSIEIRQGEKKSERVPFSSFCPLSEEGQYKVYGILRIKNQYGYMSFTSDPVMISVK